MSRIKNKIKSDQFRNLIFSLISEQFPDQMVDINGSSGSESSESREEEQIRLDKDKEITSEMDQSAEAKNPNPATLGRVKLFEADVKRALFVRGFLGFIQEAKILGYEANFSFLEATSIASGDFFNNEFTTSYLAMPSVSHYAYSSTGFGVFEDAEEIKEDLKTMNRSHGDKSPIGLAMLDSLRISNTFSFDLVKGGKGGPGQSHKFVAKLDGPYTDQEKISNFETDLESIFNDDIEFKFNEIILDLTSATDSLVNQENYKDFTSLYSYISREMRGKSPDNPSSLLEIYSGMTSFQFVNMAEDVELHMGDSPSDIKRAALQLLLGIMNMTDFLSLVFSLGGGAAGYLKTVKEVGKVRGTVAFFKGFLRYYMIAIAFQASYAGTRTTIEYLDFSRIIKSTKKVIELMIKEIKEDIKNSGIIKKVLELKGSMVVQEELVKIVNSIYKNGKIVDDYKTAIKNLYNERNPTSLQGKYSNLSLLTYDGSDPRFGSGQKSILDIFVDEVFSSFKLENIDKDVERMKAIKNSNNRFNELLTDQEAEDFLRTFYDEEGKPKEKRSLAAYKNISAPDSVLKDAIRLCIMGAIMPLGIQMQLSYAIRDKINETIETMKAKIDSSEYQVIPSEIYDSWESKVKKANIVGFKPGNNKFTVELL